MCQSLGSSHDSCTYLLGVEVGIPWYDSIRKQIFVSLRWNGWAHLNKTKIEATIGLRSFELDIAMARYRCNCQEEGTVGCGGLVEERVRFLRDYVGRVVSLVALRWASVPLKGSVEVLIGMWIEKKI